MKEKIEQLKLKYPYLSSIMIFTKAVKGKRITDFDLRKGFDDWVDKKDYQGTPKESIIKWYKRDIIKK